MVRQFFRELFARDNTDGDMRCEAEAEHPPSIYDSLIEQLEDDEQRLVRGVGFLNREIEGLEDQLDTATTNLQHTREQLAVLRAHRDDERNEPPLDVVIAYENGAPVTLRQLAARGSGFPHLRVD